MRVLYSMAKSLKKSLKKSVKKSLKKSVKKSLKNKSRRTKNRFSRKVGKRRNSGGDTVEGKVSIIPPVEGKVTLTKKEIDKINDDDEHKQLMKDDDLGDDLGDDFDDDDGFVTKSHNADEDPMYKETYVNNMVYDKTKK